MAKKKLEDKIKESKQEMDEAAEIEQKHEKYTEEQALKIAKGLVDKSEPDTLTQPISERGLFETTAIVTVDDELLETMRSQVKEINAKLAEETIVYKTSKKKIEELESEKDAILDEMVDGKTKVSVMAEWEYDWDNDVKRLRSTYKGEPIIVSIVDLTSFDRQMKLDDAINQAKELKAQEGENQATE